MHLPFAHLGKEEIKTVKHHLTVFSRGDLQRRRNPEWLIVRTFGTNHYPQIGYSDAFHMIKLPQQPSAVTVLPLRSQYGTVPVVGTDKIVRFTGEPENAILNGYIAVLLTAATAGKGKYQQQPRK